MATSAATGLASAVVNLKGMVDLDNLLDDVSDYRSLSLLV